MFRIAIYGASGYTGQELLRLLLQHPSAEVVAITSRKLASSPISEVYPHLYGATDLTFSDLSPREVAGIADIVFLALPHQASMEFVPTLLAAGRKVIDLSADFRLKSEEVYATWYGPHSYPDLLAKSVYGIPELYRREIAEARLVANPGCYPTSVILGLAPVISAGWLDPSSIIVDAKSGTSGAGREAQQGSLFCEVNEGFKAYKIGQHRHTPEIEQELGRLAKAEVQLTFTPHLLPVNRGILSSIYATLNRDVSSAEVRDLYREYFQGEEFVRICREGLFPNISSVCGTNACEIGVHVDRRMNRLTVISAIDNLLKGAAGQAVQNMNILCGLPEATGLKATAIFP
ncbi:MAG: N-acetyl-gamma-glutamyl-phosphate reductase [Smithellaceae bacterium]|nr:N-acetyl-gamma-glutamyl-phosphate reductase [Smithellaceae bacterium]